MAHRRTFKRIEKQLETRRKELLGALATGLSGTKHTTLYRAMDSPEMASATADNDMVFQFVEMESEELEQIDEALDRIREGTYGSCEVCGKAIARARLEAIPSAALCVKCKAAVEAGDMDLGSPEVSRWERVEQYEHDESEVMVTAMERGERIS